VRAVNSYVMVRIGCNWEPIADFFERNDPCRGTIYIIIIIVITASGVASYGALGHVPPPLDFQQFHF